MTTASMRRFIKRRGRQAVYREVATSGSDSWNDPTGDTPSDVETHAVVRLRGSPALTRNAAGEKIEFDAEVIVPDDVAVDPTAEDFRSLIIVSGERYKVWTVDNGTLDGAQRLLCTRSGTAGVFTDEFTDEFE